jgi:hypothetical protein
MYRVHKIAPIPNNKHCTGKRLWNPAEPLSDGRKVDDDNRAP